VDQRTIGVRAVTALAWRPVKGLEEKLERLDDVLVAAWVGELVKINPWWVLLSLSSDTLPCQQVLEGVRVSCTLCPPQETSSGCESYRVDLSALEDHLFPMVKSVCTRDVQQIGCRLQEENQTRRLHRPAQAESVETRHIESVSAGSVGDV
jgi:hypothetical protein